MEKVPEQDETKNDNYDIISSLHDSILIHILSFLKAREAVQTCVLSKRWTTVWAYLPSLNVDRDDFDSDIQLERFVRSFFRIRKIANLHTFRLKWANQFVKAANEWIHCLLDLKPRVVSIACRVDMANPFDLPSSLFCCDSLVDLSLSLYCEKSLSIDLPRLKRLKLAYMDVSDELMEKIFFGCPLLEKLELVQCILSISEVSSEVLKYLALIYCLNFTSNWISIDSPKLESLRLVGVFGNNWFSLKNISSLQKAYLSGCFCGGIDYGILNGFSNVKELTFFVFAKQGLFEKELQKCPIFSNLKKLTLPDSWKYEDFDFEGILLMHSPNLQNIIYTERPQICDEIYYDS